MAEEDSQVSSLEEEYDIVPSDVANYGLVGFWDQRYMEDPEPFEWYLGWDFLGSIVRDEVKPHHSIAYMGCGTSHLIEDLLRAGFEHVTGIDISRVLIAQLTDRYPQEEYPQLSFLQGNASYLDDNDVPDNTFDCIIDKATLDAMYCQDDADHHAEEYVKNLQRMLKEDAVFICLSVGKPDERLKLLWNDDPDDPMYKTWDCDCRGIPKPTIKHGELVDFEDPDAYYYLYVCRKTVRRCGTKRERDNRRTADRDVTITKKLGTFA